MSVLVRPNPIVAPKVTVPNGLVGYWPFGAGNVTPTLALDATSFGNNGTLSGATTPALANGKIAQALSFDGSTSFVSIANTAILNCTASFTIMAWFKASQNRSTNRSIINKWTTGATTQYDLIIETGTGKLFIEYWDGTHDIVVKSTGAVDDGNWHHGAGVRDRATGLINLYLDGALSNSASDTTSANLTNTVATTVGGVVGSPQFFNGSIDDVRIYNRALAPWEIISIYKSGFTYGRP